MRRKVVFGFTCAAVAAATIGIYKALHSSLFLVQVVEVADQPDGATSEAPVDAQTITQLAAVPTGMVNLFDLDLRSVERRILTNPWIREVRLQKRFPQTLAISVIFREPRALMQGADGALSYVDVDGRPFGSVNLKFRSDLPVLSGFSREPQSRSADALNVADALEGSASRAGAILSSLNWDNDRGYRALLAYPLQGESGPAPRAKVKKATHSSQPSAHPVARVWSRAMVDLGKEIGDPQLQRLSEVLKYLSTHSISAHQIWADAEKKIVVKTNPGS